MISQSAAAVDLNVDAGTFYVDTTNNRVGVGGKTDPDTPLHVVGTVTATLFAGSGASLTNIPNSALTNSSITINSTATSLGGSITLGTDDVAEGSSNLYYTNARADARIAAATTDDLSEGSSNLYYTDARVDARVSGGSLGNITTTGYIRGPSSFTIDPAAHGDNTGTVVIAGNLQVDGTTTTINSTTMTVDDKNITLASGSANAAAASGAGFTVDIGSGTLPAITYDGTNDEWDFNKPLNVTGNISSGAITSSGDSSVGASGNISMSAGSAGQFKVLGSGYTGAIALDANAMHIYHNSSSRDLVLGTNETARLNIGGDGVFDFQSNNLQSIGTISSGAITATGGNGDQLALNNAGERFTQISLRHSGTQNGALWLDDTDSMVDLYANTSHGIRLKTGGDNPRVTILANGNVGIGTNNPIAPLHVEGNAVIETGSPDLYFATTSASHYNWRVAAQETVDAGFEIASGTTSAGSNAVNDTYTTHFVVKSSGNVGIGTAAPNRLLEIAGYNNAGSKANYIRITDTDTSATKDNQAGGIEFFTNDSVAGIAASMEVIYAGSGGGGEFTFNTAAHSSAGVVEAMRIDASGKVGIGTSSPAAAKFSSTPDGVLNLSGNKPVVYLTEEDETDSNVWMGLSNEVGIIGNTGDGLAFRTGASTATERMRIDASGYIQMGAPISTHIGTSQLFVNRGVNAAPATSGTTQTGGALRLRGGDNAVLDMGMNSVYTWIQATDRANLANGYSLSLNPNGGNVGIGTASPDSTLDLGSATQGRALTWNSYANVWGEYSGGGLHLASNYYGNTTANTYLTSTTATFGAAGIRISGTSGSNNGGEISFYVNPETSKTAGAAFTPLERMVITKDGNVGIGPASPSSPLHVTAAKNDGWLAQLINTGTGGDANGLDIHAGVDSSDYILRTREQDGTDVMVVKYGGKVGIGTTSPDATLEVRGTEGSAAFMVTTSSSTNNNSRYQVITCTNVLATSGTWYDVAFVTHSPTIDILGRILANNAASHGGAGTVYHVVGMYGSVTAHQKTYQMYNNTSTFAGTGAIEYRYLNGGASSGSYRLQVRGTWTNASHNAYVYTTIRGMADGTMYEDD